MSGTSISASFLAADKLRLDIEHRLIALDQESSTLSNPALRTDEKDRIFQQLSEHETQCFNAINDFQRIVREVEDLVEKEVSHRRDMWRERMRQLVDRAGQFRIDANKHNMRLARERNEFQRRSLMSGRSQPQRDSLIQAYAKEESSLRSSIKAVDDMEQIGGLVMRSMQKQNEHIKNAQTRLVTVFSYLGLSNNLIRTITRREHVDRIIFWVGVVVTLIVLGLLYIYYIR